MTGWLKKARENADGTLTITGIASDASQPDCDDEILDIDRSWPYFEKRMDEMRRSSGGKSVLALRVQHDSKRVAGHVTQLWVSGQQVWAEAAVDDADAIRLVKSGTLSQLSFGGNYIDREYLSDGVYSIVIDPMELSLVDVARVSGAVLTSVEAAEGFELYKRCGDVEVVSGKRHARPDNDEGGEEGQECSMNASDHSHLAKLHRKVAAFHRSVHDTHNEIAAHHEKMAGHQPSPSTFGEVTQRTMAATRSMVKGKGKYGEDPDDYDASGGLRKGSWN